jgi:tRNA(Ile)-lysidine synthase
MLEEFEKFIAENKLISQGDRVLLAVSGGIDSMVMTHLFLQLGTETGIAHCNFTLRGNESDKDEEMVRKFSSEHNIPFYSVSFATKSYAKNNGLSVQMAARELRYEWFERIRKEHGYNKVAVAHNLNDNIETLLINLTRGTGISGLTGMKPVSGYIIRPLLFATRKDISSYCSKHQVIFREDKSNADTKYTRNKIRHKVIPVLREINPSVETTLNETAGRFKDINEIVSEYISDLREKTLEQNKDLITFNVSLLKSYFHNKTILFELFKSYGITSALLKDLMSVIEGKTGGRLLTDTHRIIKNRKELIISPCGARKETFYKIENISELRMIPELVSVKQVSLGRKPEFSSDPLVACIDSEKISFPMFIRKWKEGDHFYPLGMKNRKKLSDYFIDNKYSIPEKENKLILESDGKIVWIIGDRIDNRFRITGSTKKALIITTSASR